MGIFRKKIKEKSVGQIKAEKLMEHALNFKPNKCSELQLQTKSCVCIDCPKRQNGCQLEKAFAASHTCNENFITSCSYKNFLKGEYDEKKEGNHGGTVGNLINGGDLSCFDEVSTVRG